MESLTSFAKGRDGIRSPLTGSDNVLLKREYDVAAVTRSYKRMWNVDVSYLFRDLQKISLYQCLDTEYLFYYPFSISGDSRFYEAMQVQEGYYMDWKWEHEEARRVLKPGARILEVGCGKGAFIKRISDLLHATCIGLELNQNAMAHGRLEGLPILDESVETHSLNHQHEYDAVCAFQVLEHLWDVKGFVLACLRALKSGGRLIIGVPNNDSYLRHFKYCLSNMPPHHMGLWNSKSLKSLQGLFQLRLEDIRCEPLQPYHFSGFMAASLEQILRADGIPFKLLFHAVNPFRNLVLGPVSRRIKGHTIVAVYSKL